MKRLSCASHNTQTDHPWVICIHVAHGTPPKLAERMVIDENNVAAGQVLCEVCAADIPAALAKRDLKPACESCVLERWRLDDAS